MGFRRQGQPTALDRTALTAVVTLFLADEAPLAPTADPCPLDPAGGPHVYTACCGNVACAYCSKIAWG